VLSANDVLNEARQTTGEQREAAENARRERVRI